MDENGHARDEHGPDTAQGPPVLSLKNIDAGYGKVRVVHDVDLSVPSSSVVALIGANGAGKSTLLRVACGLIRPASGTVAVGGADMTRADAYQRARSGVCLIPEGRGIYRSLSVRENLELHVPPWIRSIDVAPAIEAFPVLGERLNQVAGSLSGGEQQMLALSRAYLSNPRIIMLDEVSLGLAPLIVDEIFASLHQLAATSVALLIVEQYVNRVLDIADSVYLMAHGEMRWNGAPSELDSDAVASSYLGG